MMTETAIAGKPSSPQSRMQGTLEGVGLPYREIKVYGTRITVECVSEATASKWASLLATFATVQGVIPSTVQAAVQHGTSLCPTMILVWRVYAKV